MAEGEGVEPCAPKDTPAFQTGVSTTPTTPSKMVALGRLELPDPRSERGAYTSSATGPRMERLSGVAPTIQTLSCASNRVFRLVRLWAENRILVVPVGVEPTLSFRKPRSLKPASLPFLYGTKMVRVGRLELPPHGSRPRMPPLHHTLKSSPTHLHRRRLG